MTIYELIEKIENELQQDYVFSFNNNTLIYDHSIMGWDIYFSIEAPANDVDIEKLIDNLENEKDRITDIYENEFKDDELGQEDYENHIEKIDEIITILRGLKNE